MKVLRALLALFIIAVFALPVLFGVIWTVGVTTAAVSPSFVSDLPQDIITEIPSLLDEIFDEARDERQISDPEVRAWFEAADRLGVSPRELLQQAGLQDWLENEVSKSLEDMGEMLRGERRARTIAIDLRPLKDSLRSGALEDYFLSLLANLPPCDAYGAEEWKDFFDYRDNWSRMPACRPDPVLAREYLERQRWEILEDMPDEVSLFDNVRMFPMGISRTVSLLSYGLFILPLVLIFVAALIAACTPSGFFKWFGTTTFVGGLITLGSGAFIQGATNFAWKFMPYVEAERWTHDLQELILAKTDWIFHRVLTQLFSPVISLAGAVCIVGLVFFVISFAVRSQPRTPRAPQPAPVPTAPELEPPKSEEPKPEESKPKASEPEVPKPAASKPEPSPPEIPVVKPSADSDKEAKKEPETKKTKTD